MAVTGLHVYVSLLNAVGVEGLGTARYLADATLACVLGRWAVPAFLMVTGMFLLDPKRKVDAKRLWGYAQRMLFALATFGFAFCLIESVYDQRALTLAVVADAVKNLLTGHSWDHLWYVYALLGLYALTPLLRRVVASLTRRGLAALVAVAYVVVLVVPTLLDLQGVFIATPANIVPAVFYFLLGHFVATSLDLSPATVAAGIVSLCALVGVSLAGNDYLALPEFCLVAPWGALVFLLFRRYATWPLEGRPLAARVASASFGIYVVHPFFLHLLVRLVDPLVVPAGVFELGAFALALAASLATVSLLRRIPVFARYF